MSAEWIAGVLLAGTIGFFGVLALLWLAGYRPF